MKRLYISYELENSEWVEKIESYIEENEIFITNDISESDAYLYIVSDKTLNKTSMIKELEFQTKRGIQPIFGLIENVDLTPFFDIYSDGIKLDLKNGGKEALQALVYLCKKQPVEYTFSINPELTENNKSIFDGDIVNKPEYMKYMEKIAEKRQRAFYNQYKDESVNVNDSGDANADEDAKANTDELIEITKSKRFDPLYLGILAIVGLIIIMFL